jgi:hypothetical protein
LKTAIYASEKYFEVSVVKVSARSDQIKEGSYVAQFNTVREKLVLRKTSTPSLFVENGKWYEWLNDDKEYLVQNYRLIIENFLDYSARLFIYEMKKKVIILVISCSFM